MIRRGAGQSRPLTATRAGLLAVFVAAALISGCGTAGPRVEAGQALDASAYEIDPWTFAGVSGVKITTPHYHLFSTAERDFALRMAAFMEAAAAQYQRLTGLGAEIEAPGEAPAAAATPRERMKVYLFADRAQWAALTRRIIGDDAPAMGISAGGYCVNGICVFWNIGRVNTARVAVHEGLHQFLAHRTYQRLADWTEELLAVSAEGFEMDGRSGAVRFDAADNPNRRAVLRELLLAGRAVSVESLVSQSSTGNIQDKPFHAVDYYAQLWALGEMLRARPGGQAAIRRLCAAAAAGRLRAALGVSRSRWRAALRDPASYNRVVARASFVAFILDGDAEALAAFEAEYLDFARRLVE